MRQNSSLSIRFRFVVLSAAAALVLVFGLQLAASGGSSENDAPDGPSALVDAPETSGPDIEPPASDPPEPIPDVVSPPTGNFFVTEEPSIQVKYPSPTLEQYNESVEAIIECFRGVGFEVAVQTDDNQMRHYVVAIGDDSQENYDLMIACEEPYASSGLLDYQPPGSAPTIEETEQCLQDKGLAVPEADLTAEERAEASHDILRSGGAECLGVASTDPVDHDLLEFE